MRRGDGGGIASKTVVAMRQVGLRSSRRTCSAFVVARQRRLQFCVELRMYRNRHRLAVRVLARLGRNVVFPNPFRSLSAWTKEPL